MTNGNKTGTPGLFPGGNKPLLPHFLIFQEEAKIKMFSGVSISTKPNRTPLCGLSSRPTHSRGVRSYEGLAPVLWAQGSGPLHCWPSPSPADVTLINLSSSPTSCLRCFRTCYLVTRATQSQLVFLLLTCLLQPPSTRYLKRWLRRPSLPFRAFSICLAYPSTLQQTMTMLELS